MSIDRATAEAMRDLFELARDSAPLRQTRSEMHARAREWNRALDTLAEMGDDWVIELAGAVTPYMSVAGISYDGRPETHHVIRVIHRDGTCTVHAEDPIGQARYTNLHSPTSPVVVKA